jgi:hypothetical protein
MSEDLKAKLLAPRATTASGMPEDTVTLAGFGDVRVRGLSRGEVFMLQKARDTGVIKDQAQWEQRMVSLTLLDPPMTDAEVAQWQTVAGGGGELEDVTAKIAELSNMAAGSAKAAVQSFRGEPDN